MALQCLMHRCCRVAPVSVAPLARRLSSTAAPCLASSSTCEHDALLRGRRSLWTGGRSTRLLTVLSAAATAPCTRNKLVRWSSSTTSSTPNLTVLGTSYPADDYTNIPRSILARLQSSPVLPYSPSHPLRLLREQIEGFLPGFTSLPAPSPVVSTQLNFEDLGFPEDHPGRAPSDTYYLNRKTCLRTHTSAHEVQTFRDGHERWLLAADVYRRDEVDASHYPVFHQMEGASVWGPSDDVWGPGGLVERQCEEMEERLKHAAIIIEDDVSLDAAGGWQQGMDQEKAKLALRHLKGTLNGLALHLFGPRHEQDVRDAQLARASAGQAGSSPPPTPHADAASEEALRVRWIDATFPFTTPSFEVEVWFRGRWLEILGCGVVKQATLDKAGVPEKLGWAFGLGLERIAMVLYSIPDIRLFWTQDPRFLEQFSGSVKLGTEIERSQNEGRQGGKDEGTSTQRLATFRPYSRFPPCYKDVSFWLPAEADGSSGVDAQFSSTGRPFHMNDLAELLRDEAADLVENLSPVDEFVHPHTGRKSLCLRVAYRSMDRSLENKEVNAIHDNVVRRMKDELGLEIR